MRLKTSWPSTPYFSMTRKGKWAPKKTLAEFEHGKYPSQQKSQSETEIEIMNFFEKKLSFLVIFKRFREKNTAINFNFFLHYIKFSKK